MSGFHCICDADLTLSENRTVAEAAEYGTLFSAAPLSPGETFSVRVTEGQIGDLHPHLYLGVTEQSPLEWREGGKEPPYQTTETSCLFTWDGFLWQHGRQAGYCDQWREKMGEEHILATGDILSLSLHGDRSLSITHNDTEVTRVFTDLPDNPLWVVIKAGVRQLEVLQTACATLQIYSALAILKSTRSDNINKLALPTKLIRLIKEL